MITQRTRRQRIRPLSARLTEVSARKSRRLGAATVEAAITLPLLFVFVFGSIELANGIFLKQSLTIAAYEGARTATRAGGTATQAQQRIQDVLSSRGITDQSVTISPNVNAATPRGTMVTVTVQVSSDSVAIGPLHLLQGAFLQQSAVMVRL